MIHIVKELDFLKELCEALVDNNQILASALIRAEVARLKLEVEELERKSTV